MLLIHTRSTVWAWGRAGAADLQQGRDRARSPIAPTDPGLGSRPEDTPSLAQSRGPHDCSSPHGRSDLSPDSTTHPGPSREQGPLWPLRALHPLGGGALWTTAGKPGLQPYSACLPGQRTRFLMPQLRPRAAKEILTIKKQQKKQPQQSRPSGAKPQRSGTTRFWLSGSHGTPSRRSNMANESFQSTWPGDEFPRKRG